LVSADSQARPKDSSVLAPWELCCVTGSASEVVKTYIYRLFCNTKPV